MAKIIGNTTVTPYPRPDWNQTDENRADYIKNKPDISALQDQITEVESIAKGRASGRVFDTYEAMIEWLAKPENVDELKQGDNFYIRATNVPDYWWDGSSAQQLETQKVDLTEYVEKEDGKGLSAVNDVWIEEQAIGYIGEEMETFYSLGVHRNDTEDDMLVYFYDTEQTKAMVDKKLAELPQGGDVDLSDYCTKEEIDKIHNDGIVTLKKNISFTVGENIITNDTPVILSNGWTKGSSGEYIHNSKLTNPLEVQINAADGAIYYVEWDLDFDKATSQSSASVAIGESYSQDTYFGKSHIEMIVKCEGGGSLYITPLDSFNGSITNISCKPLTDGDGLVITQEFNSVYMDDVNTDNYGRWNVILSDNAMLNTVNSTRSIAIGHSALNACKGGNRNIAIGTFSMSKMNGGERNVSIGSDSMLEVKAATDNISIGVGAMYYGANPSNNIAIGKDALQGYVDFENHQVNDSTIVGNIAIGYQAGLHTKANNAWQGARNVFVGNQSGYANTTGYNNVGVGAGALNGNKTGHSNTCIGVNATVTNGSVKSIAIGYASKATQSNQAVIGSQYIVNDSGIYGIKETVLYGDLIVYGTDAIGRNVATENYVDTKIAELSSSGGNVDLSGYYTKPETDELLLGKLNAGIADYYVSQLEIDELDNTIDVRDENDQIQLRIKIPSDSFEPNGTVVDLSDYYNQTEINTMLNSKRDKSNIRILNTFDPDNDWLCLEQNDEIYITSPITFLQIGDITIDFAENIGSKAYLYFTSGDSIEFDDMNSHFTCIGDDCNDDGTFIPLPNTSYEITFHNVGNKIIARVGAC